jgi:hypothetical protein
MNVETIATGEDVKDDVACAPMRLAPLVAQTRMLIFKRLPQSHSSAELPMRISPHQLAIALS